MLAIGHLYRSIDFLNFLEENEFSKEEFLQSYPFFMRIESHYIIDLCKNCGWIGKENGKLLILTEQGRRLLENPDLIAKLRIQIKDIIKYYSPKWMLLIHRGRNEVKRNMNLDEIHCFTEAKLFDEDYDVIEWWDSFIIQNYKDKERENYETGRKGENLSLQYEEKRTGFKPKLMSLDVNYAGYDILSRRSKKDSRPLFIEVKSSKEHWDNAKFYLTRNEWEIFTLNPSSIIHLWTLNSKTSFSKLTYDNIESSIPKDQGEGKWKNVEIPFKITSPIQQA